MHSPAVEETSGTSAKIIHGTISMPADDAVVAIAMRPDGHMKGGCSGTLVAKNLVLTARHCVSSYDAHLAITGDYAPGELSVYIGLHALADAFEDHDATDHAVARGKQVIVETSRTLEDADVAFVVLDAAVDAPTKTIRLAGPTKGETITAIGFGLTEDGYLPYMREKRGSIEITDVSDTEFLVGESACSGDSGGPAIGADDEIVGVVSRGGGDGKNAAGFCTGKDTMFIYTHLANKKDLVSRALAAAGPL